MPPPQADPKAVANPIQPAWKRSGTVYIVGLDGLSHVKRVWRGGLVGVTVRVAFWRIAAGEIPAGEEARIDWLFAQWRRVDDWVCAHRAEPCAGPT